MSVWCLQISTGELVAEAACHNGTPPQVRGVVWSPSALQAGYVGQDLRGSCDVLCTIGARHLKFWAFQRPAGGSRAPIPLLSRSHKMGKVRRADPVRYSQLTTYSEGCDVLWCCNGWPVLCRSLWT